MSVKIIPVSIGLFIHPEEHQGLSLWMQKRSEGGPTQGLWEFPGGKIEVGERADEALKREIGEEVGLTLLEDSCFRLMQIFSYDSQHGQKDGQKRFVLHVFVIKTRGDDLTVLDQKGKWFLLNEQTLSEPLQGQIPSVNHQIIDPLIKTYCSYKQSSLEQAFWAITQVYHS
jgi:8-oxo-dGTP diphosphatase